MEIQRLLQQIQDAFAEQLHLTLFITDESGKAITSFSNLTPLTTSNLIKKRASFIEKLANQKKFFNKLDRPLLIDASSVIGIKTIVSPIQINGTNSYFIWAGFIIEQGYKTFVVNSTTNNDLQTFIQSVDEHSLSAIEEKIQLVKDMTNVCKELIEGQLEKEKSSLRLDLFSHLLDQKKTSHGRYNHLLHVLLQIDSNLDFVGYAIHTGNHSFKVTHADGRKKEQLFFLSFSIHDTYFQEAIEKRQFQTWQHVSNNAHAFFLHDLQPKALFCFPIIVNEEIIGLLFGGTSMKESISAKFIDYQNILMPIFTSSLQIDYLEESFNRHLMRMSSILDISKAMQLAKKLDELLIMFVDMALKLVPGKFGIITLKNGSHFSKVNDAHIDPNEISTYLIDHADTSLLSENFKMTEPKLTETNWGTILTYPILSEKDLKGIFSIHLNAPSKIMEAEVYLTNLTNIFTIALFHLESKESQKSEEFKGHEQSTFLELLTARELDVLKHLAKGSTNREIADLLFISVHTVKNHITNIS